MHKCPLCDSDDLEAGTVGLCDCGKDEFACEAWCNSCGAEWIEYYTFERAEYYDGTAVTPF